MTNAATELAEILSAWDTQPNSSVWGTRSRAVADDVDLVWRENAHAVQLLTEVITELDAMEAAGDNVSDYRAYVGSWFEGIFSYHHPWNQSYPQIVLTVPVESIRMLRVLGHLISKTGTASVGSPTRRAALLECIREAVDLIDTELADWDRAEKEYLYRITTAARNALEQHSLHGEVNLTSLLNELIGALTGIAIDIRSADGSDSPKFQKFMSWVGKTSTVTRGIVYDMDALTSLALSAGAIAGAITS